MATLTRPGLLLVALLGYTAACLCELSLATLPRLVRLLCHDLFGYLAAHPGYPAAFSMANLPLSRCLLCLDLHGYLLPSLDKLPRSFVRSSLAISNDHTPRHRRSIWNCEVVRYIVGTNVTRNAKLYDMYRISKLQLKFMVGPSTIIAYAMTPFCDKRICTYIR